MMRTGDTNGMYVLVSRGNLEEDTLDFILNAIRFSKLTIAINIVRRTGKLRWYTITICHKIM